MPWNPDGTRKRSSLYKKSSGFKMKGISPLKKGKVGMYGYVPHTKKVHKDPLVHQLSRQPENFYMSPIVDMIVSPFLP